MEELVHFRNDSGRRSRSDEMVLGVEKWSCSPGGLDELQTEEVEMVWAKSRTGVRVCVSMEQMGT